MTLFQYIKSQVLIADLVGEYVTLRPAGNYLKGNCPFHSEKTASFTVSPSKGIYYCFGCHESGDVISFLAKIEHISQYESAQELISRYNIEIPEDLKENKDPKKQQQKKELSGINDFFSSWICSNFNNSIAHEYLKDRGLNLTRNNSLFGYFPRSSRDKFIKDSLSNGYLVDDLQKWGILSRSSSGVYSPFEDRIIFVIKDHIGRPIGFGGRVFLANDNRAKYYNSRENSLFKKGQTVFGIDVAKKYIQKKGYVILVEGYLDCFMLWQAGFINSVATMGTACTIEQLTLISRYTNTIYVMYDSDAAGINAMLKLVDLCWQVSLDLKVISLPKNVDPAEYINNGGDINKLIDKALDIYNYYINSSVVNFNTKSYAEKIDQVKDIIKIIEKVTDPIKRDLLISDASKAFGLPSSLLKIKPNKHGGILEKQFTRKSSFSYEEIPGLQKRFISLLLHDTNLYEKDFDLWAEGLRYPLNEILFFIANLSAKNRHWQDDVWELEKDIRETVHRIALEYDQKDDILNFQFIKNQFKKIYWKDIVKSFKEKIALAENSGDLDLVQTSLEKFEKLRKTF